MKIEIMGHALDNQATVNSLREKIDDIDDTIVKLIGERFELVRQIGELKQQHNFPVQDPQREAKVYVKLQALADKHNVPLEVIIHIYDFLMGASRAEQK